MRHILPTAAFIAALLIAGSAFAAPPASASATPPAAGSSAASAPKLSPADQKRIEAIQQYQHDLVNVVALRADSAHLLGAAILAKPFRNQTPGLDFDALSARAAAAPNAGPAAEWVRLSLCKNKADCPNPQAFAYLKRHAADNAAVWLIGMDFAADDKAARADLKKAAAAQFYDDYYGQVLSDIVKAVSVLPPLSDTTAGAHDGQPDNPDGVQVFVAALNAQDANISPGFDPLDRICWKDSAARNAGIKTDCLKLAHTLQWGSSPLARAMGLRIQGELEPDAADQTNPASRNLAWQVHQYSRLLQRSLTDPTLASRWLTTARNGGTELSLILATLRANQIPLDAPADVSASPAEAGSSGQ
jgi:hypothetical protein